MAKSARKQSTAIGLPLRLLLTLILTLAPIGALAATTQPGAMPAACGMVLGMGMGMGDHDNMPMSCCNALCAVSGNCAVLPTPCVSVQPVTFGKAIVSGRRSQDRAGISSAPEPPPPRGFGS